MENKKLELIKEIKNNPISKKFIQDFNLTDDQIEKNAITIYSFLLSEKKCALCDGSSCVQDITGYKPVLEFDKFVNISYVPCNFAAKKLDDKKRKENLIEVCCSLDHINPVDLFKNNERKEIWEKVKESYATIETDSRHKGIYLHGKYGVGKSYIFGCLAKKYASNGHEVIYAYYPDLVRKIKSLIATNGVEAVVEDLQSVEVLFLDDFGGETLTSFIRDEVLNPILQYRMDNNLMTYMTSNISPSLLHQHLKESQKDEDELKASRIEERIKVLMSFVELSDKNYRV